MELKGKRILIFQQRGWAINIGHFLAKKLRAEECRLAAVTLKKTTHQFISEQKDVQYELVISNDQVMENPQDYLAGDDFTLEEICENLGIDSIWPFVYSLRNHVRSYRDKYYYGFKQNVSDEEIEAYIKAVYKYLKIVFEGFNPELIISPNFIALPHIMFYFYAKKRGIKMIGITDSKIKGVYLFVNDYNDSEGEFFDYLEKLNSGAEPKDRQRAKQYIQEFREKFKAPDHALKPAKKITLYGLFRRELSPYVQIVKWYLRGPSANYLKNLGISIDYRPPKIILRDHYCEKLNRRFMEKLQYYPLEKLQKFVYFPLQFQPEASIDVIAPYFSNQIETARQIAMSLPDDYTLAVKEHPAMIGLRPASYIKKLLRTVNVKMIDCRTPSEAVIKKADLVISPNSTTLAETAFLKKPAIQLGNLGTTLRLPNVFHHTDLSSLAGKIKLLLQVDLDTDEYDKRLENYVAAAFETGFDFNYFRVWEKGKGDMESLWEIYQKEIKRIFEQK